MYPGFVIIKSDILFNDSLNNVVTEVSRTSQASVVPIYPRKRWPLTPYIRKCYSARFAVSHESLLRKMGKAILNSLFSTSGVIYEVKGNDRQSRRITINVIAKVLTQAIISFVGINWFVSVSSLTISHVKIFKHYKSGVLKRSTFPQEISLFVNHS